MPPFFFFFASTSARYSCQQRKQQAGQAEHSIVVQWRRGLHLPANRDKMQSPESDGKVDDDMMKANIQKQKKREHDYFFNVSTMGLRKRTVRARRQQQTVSAGVGDLLAEGRILRFGLWFILGTIRRPTGKIFSELLLCWRSFDWLRIYWATCSTNWA